MIENFERLCTGVNSIYKSVRRIQQNEMTALGLSCKHVLPFYFLMMNREGLTAAELCTLCNVDKAGISRVLSEMKEMGYVAIEKTSERRAYRSKVLLTGAGEQTAEVIRERILRATMEGGQTVSEEEREIFYRVLGIIGANLVRAAEQTNE